MSRCVSDEAFGAVDVDGPHTSGTADLRPFAHRSAHYRRCVCAEAKRIVKTALERGRQHVRSHDRQ
jgi:hypothetical protein